MSVSSEIEFWQEQIWSELVSHEDFAESRPMEADLPAGLERERLSRTDSDGASIRPAPVLEASRKQALVGRSLASFPYLSMFIETQKKEPLLVYTWSIDDPHSLALGRMIRARRFAAVAINVNDTRKEAEAVAGAEGIGGELLVGGGEGLHREMGKLRLLEPGALYIISRERQIVEVHARIDFEEKVTRWGFANKPLVRP